MSNLLMSYETHGIKRARGVKQAAKRSQGQIPKHVVVNWSAGGTLSIIGRTYALEDKADFGKLTDSLLVLSPKLLDSKLCCLLLRRP